MNKFVQALALALIATSSYAQKVSNIDFDAIQQRSQDSTSNFYFPHLSQRLKDLDTTMTFLEFEHLYYGQTFEEGYNPYGTDENEKEFFAKFREKNYAEAIPIGRKILDKDPLNLTVTYKMLVCHHFTSDKVTARRYGRIYFDLLDVIYKSGDGKSHKTAFVVARVADEYDLINDLELEMVSQGLSNETDILTVNRNLGDKVDKKKGKGYDYIHFNVSKPLAKLRNSF